MAKELRDRRKKRNDDVSDTIDDLDFEFVLFASAIIDYDYIMELITRYYSGAPSMSKMTKDQLISLICSSSNMLDERDDIIDFINSHDSDSLNGKTVQEIKEEYEVFKAEKYAAELSNIANAHKLNIVSLQQFVNNIVERKIFDGEKLNELLEPLELGWKARANEETILMNDLMPLLKKMVAGQEISRIVGV